MEPIHCGSSPLLRGLGRLSRTFVAVVRSVFPGVHLLACHVLAYKVKTCIGSEDKQGRDFKAKTLPAQVKP